MLLHFKSSEFWEKIDIQQFIPVSGTNNNFFKLIAGYKGVNFSLFPANNGFPTNKTPTKSISMTHYAQLTAATIYYKGNILLVIKYCQGPYTCALRDRKKNLQLVQDK